MDHSTSTPAEDRLSRLFGYLEQDPDNLHLIADAADAARRAKKFGVARALVGRYGALSELPPEIVNLSGLIALDDGRFQEAADLFDQAADGTDDPGVAYNRAWAHTLLKDDAAALAALDDDAAASTPQAALLRVQLLHRTGRLAEAKLEGERLARRFPAAPELSGALAVLAMDLGEVETARAYAGAAEATPDGLSVLGILALDEQRPDAAAAHFARALSLSPDHARSHLGIGLHQLNSGAVGPARSHLERAASLFGSHPGSWIAAGWANYVAGDATASRRAFEKALGLDEGFAEAHGGLAVLDLSQGRQAEAERRMQVALRLDRACLSANLAKIMLLRSRGQGAAADLIEKVALNRPLDSSGRTIAGALVKLNLGSGSGQR